MNTSSNVSVSIAATLLLALSALQPAHAASVASGSASGHALDVGLSAFSGSLSLNVGPFPAAVWLFGSGLVGLIGVARKRAAAV